MKVHPPGDLFVQPISVLFAVKRSSLGEEAVMGGPFFRSSRRKLSVLVGAAVLTSLAVVGVSAEEPLDPVLGDPGLTYPDLQPDVQNVFVDTFNGPPRILFDTWSKNLGQVSLQVTAEPSENPMAPNVSQCVSWYSPRVCRAQRPVGGFSWHDEHTHFHFNDFATYALRRLLPDGTPDYSSAGLISVSEKVSFCLIDLVDLDEEDDSPAPFYTLANCYAPAVMGISPLWADNYDSSLPGQELSLAGLPDGRYALIVDQDPQNRLFETDDTNNRVVVTVNVTGLGTLFPQVTIVDRQYPTTGGGGTTTTSTTTSTSTTTTSTTSTSTSTTSTSTTSTTVCRGGGGGGGGGGNGGGGGGGGGSCRPPRKS